MSDVRDPPPSRKPGLLYAIRAGAHGPVKLGITTDLKARLRLLQTGNHLPLRPIWSMDGMAQVEYFLHSKFSELRCPKGEWFSWGKAEDEEIVTNIETVVREFRQENRPRM